MREAITAIARLSARKASVTALLPDYDGHGTKACVSAVLGVASGRDVAATTGSIHAPSLPHQAKGVQWRYIPCLQELLHNCWLSPDRCRSPPVGSALSRYTTCKHLVRRSRHHTNAQEPCARPPQAQQKHARYTQLCAEHHKCATHVGEGRGERSSGQQRRLTRIV